MKELFRKIHEKLILIFCHTIGSRKYSERKDKYSMIKVKVLIISSIVQQIQNLHSILFNEFSLSKRKKSTKNMFIK